MRSAHGIAVAHLTATCRWRLTGIHQWHARMEERAAP
jgi:hypothetical protein